MRVAVAAVLLAGAWVGNARADLLIYQLQGKVPVPLWGTVRHNPGNTVTYTHPQFGELSFAKDQVQYKKTKSVADLVNREFARAKNTKKPDEMMKAARYAAKKGLSLQAYKMAEEVKAVDPQNKDAARMLSIRDHCKQRLPETDVESQKKTMIDIVHRDDMKFLLSNHFMLMHDTDPKPRIKHKLNRADERIQLLEKVYETFLLVFFSQGIELDLPKQRLMVVLFSEHKHYLFFATSLHKSLAATSGFYNIENNVAFFFDHSTEATFQSLQEATAVLTKQRDEAVRQKLPGRAEIVRRAETLEILVEVLQQDNDIEVVSHECTHQLASNTGLLPRHIQVPKWVHEGLATYFETPGSASWAGVGAVNEGRLGSYRQLVRDPVHSKLSFAISDEVFGLAASLTGTILAYGQAWSLTHFLMENDTERLIKFYRRLGELPPDATFSPEVLTRVFQDVFGDNLVTLESKWRTHMDKLKTPLEEVIDDVR